MSTGIFPERNRLEDLLTRAVQRRSYLTALALVSPGGRLWASALPEGVEAESIAAMAAPAALLGRRIAMEQLDTDMRQVYVEGAGGYAILRAVGEAAVLVTVAAAGANLALVLRDVIQLENHVAEVMGTTAYEARKWAEAGPAIERLRQLVGEGQMPGMLPEQPDVYLQVLRDKLDSLDLGWFPERVAAARAKLDTPNYLDEPEHVEEIELELLVLERDVMAQVEQQMMAPVPPPIEEEVAVAAEAQVEREEPIDTRGSFIRRALRWLASMIASED